MPWGRANNFHLAWSSQIKRQYICAHEAEHLDDPSIERHIGEQGLDRQLSAASAVIFTIVPLAITKTLFIQASAQCSRKQSIQSLQCQLHGLRQPTHDPLFDTFPHNQGRCLLSTPLFKSSTLLSRTLTSSQALL